MIPLLPLAIRAVVAGVCFAVGKKLTDSYLIPWTELTAEDLDQRWEKSAEARRKRQLDEIDPGPDTRPN